MPASRTLTDRIYEFLENPSPRVVIGALFVMHIIVHLPFMGLPPVSAHSWRQAIGSAAARNFYEEDSNILYPRSDVRMSDDAPGYNYQEFPGYYWLVGQSYRLTGFNHYNPRIIVMLINFLLLIAVYQLQRRIGFTDRTAIYTAFFIGCSPLYFYYCFNLLPNLPSLMLFCSACVFFIDAARTGTFGWRYWLAVSCLTLSVISKAEYLFYGIPLAWLFIDHFLKSKNKRIIFQAGIAATIALSVWIVLYRHSINLRDTAPAEIAEKLTLHASPVQGGIGEYLEIFWIALNKWFIEVVLGFAAVPFFAVGLYHAIKIKFWRQSKAIFLLLYLASFTIYAYLFGGLFRNHDYYFTSALFLTGLTCAYGARILLAKHRYIALALLVLMPAVAYGRVAGRWIYDKQVPQELLTDLDEIQAHLPKDKRVVIVGGRTPNVILYHLHRKGVSYYTVDQERLAYLRAHGFEYIFSYDKNDAMQGIDDDIERLAEIGQVSIYKILR